MQLVLQPCGDSDAAKHYVDTIANRVPISRILPHLQANERNSFQTTFSEPVAVWGVTPGVNDVNAKKWRRVQTGDTALLYRNKRFFFKGTIAFKTRSYDLAKELWSVRTDNTTWEYIFVLTDLEAIEIPVESFNAAAGYKPTNIIQGFNVLPPEMSERICEELDLQGGMGPTLPDEVDLDETQKALDRLSGDLDGRSSGKSRKEQPYLRKLVLGKRPTEHCSLCGRELPVDLIWIGHIRKRNSCDTEMRKDLANVMPVCLLGCDVLFEKGYVFVDGKGTIRQATQRSVPSDLIPTISRIVGQTCRAWNLNSSRYFLWHRDAHFNH